MGKRSKQVTISDVQKVVEHHFPELWPAVEAGLATIATLLLKDNANPATIIYLGPPSAGKTTVVNMFSGHPITYRSDKFTPASFVSQKADVSEEKLGKIDLLPKIRYKCFLTPDMAPNFSGNRDTVQDRLSVMTRVLDGQGLWTDTGAHGGRGYRGDYLFSWIGATTPFHDDVWNIMGSMGSRLFFWPMIEKVLTERELVESQRGVPYRSRVKSCSKIVHKFLDQLFGTDLSNAVRSVSWDPEGDPDEVMLWIAKLAKLLVALRSKEAEFRAMTVLTNFAKGLAIVRDRRQLTVEDLPRIAQFAVGSIPDRKRRGFIALIRAGGWMRVSTASQILGCSIPTAERTMEACDGEVMKYVKGGRSMGKELTHLSLQEDWVWCLQLRDLLGGPFIAEGDNFWPTVPPQGSKWDEILDRPELSDELADYLDKPALTGDEPL